jgi:hypothetical protein
MKLADPLGLGRWLPSGLPGRRNWRSRRDSPCSSSVRFGVLSVPQGRALSAQFHRRSKHALCALPRSVPRGLRLSWTIGELRPLRWVVREEHLGFALSHPPDRGRESTRVRSACLLAERSGTRVPCEFLPLISTQIRVDTSIRARGCGVYRRPLRMRRGRV